jgi:hypothetical protein
MLDRAADGCVLGLHDDLMMPLTHRSTPVRVRPLEVVEPTAPRLA